ncbi:MAG: cation diffusion facilitator family transporter [Patescibacteria group bacterium]|nr:cation diffusion facilitator family transporter [Patescibacteria group bacterium]
MEDLKTDRRLSAKRIILTSFLTDVVNVFVSLVVAILSGSVIMLTQFLQNFSDLISSGLLLIGIMRSMRNEDKTHPFGYGREIYFWTFLAALIMFGITSTFSFYLGFRRFLQPTGITNISLVFLVLFITLVTNSYSFLLSYKRLVNKRSFFNILKIFYKSSLVETKTTFTLDLMGVLTSIMGFLAILVYVSTGNMRLDGIGAMGIGIVMAIISVFLIFGIKDMLVGKAASYEVEDKIRKTALSVDKVDAITDLKTLHIGSEKLLVSLDVEIAKGLKIKDLEKIIGTIELEIRKVVPSAKYVLVELGT